MRDAPFINRPTMAMSRFALVVRLAGFGDILVSLKTAGSAANNRTIARACGSRTAHPSGSKEANFFAVLLFRKPGCVASRWRSQLGSATRKIAGEISTWARAR
jgi:hypothetical protein